MNVQSANLFAAFVQTATKTTILEVGVCVSRFQKAELMYVVLNVEKLELMTTELWLE
jgi:hypothetical protein